MKIFGTQLFHRESETLWDFAQFGIVKIPQNVYYEMTTTTAVQVPQEKVTEKKTEVFLTPKGLYKMSALDDKKFFIQTDETYLKNAIEDCKKKIEILPREKKPKRGRNNELQFIEPGAIHYGREQIRSIIERLDNRRRIKEWEPVFKRYPHTTNTLLRSVLKEHKHLGFQKAEAFVPDLPREAISAMNEYNKMCQKLCNKKTNFYVIAQSKDFERVNENRDPILLAQSPFGFFWSILGAWDEEIVYLDEL